MGIFDWAGYTKRLVKVRNELREIVEEFEPEIASTNGKLKRVMESHVRVVKILVRVLESLPGFPR